LFLIASCKKQEIPTVTTSAITDITGTTATCGGTITDEGTGTVIERGVCYSKGITPTIADCKTTNGTGAGTFTSNISDLDGASTYYVRAYATNNTGTGYGMVMSFSSLGQIPTAVTNPATNITTTSTRLNGTVNSNYLSTIVTFEYGTSTSYSNTATATQSPVSGDGNTNVSVDISGLLPATTYHFRVKTINSLGTTYGNEISFTTSLSIGDFYCGGIVAYILQTGDPGYVEGETHGLIAAPSDLGLAQWGCYETTISGADGAAIGTGNQNTIDIVTGCTTAGIAAKRCYDLTLDGYSDWYLPSKDELNRLFINKVAIGGFANYGYWSSSENNDYYAWLQSFINGFQSYDKKYFTYYVRAIRAF
jgi:hypothetical protein